MIQRSDCQNEKARLPCRGAEVETGRQAGRHGSGRKTRYLWETHHSIDASILRKGLVEAADRGQEDDVAVIEERDPGRCYVGRTEVEVREDRGS